MIAANAPNNTELSEMSFSIINYNPKLKFNVNIFKVRGQPNFKKPLAASVTTHQSGGRS